MKFWRSAWCTYCFTALAISQPGFWDYWYYYVGFLLIIVWADKDRIDRGLRIGPYDVNGCFGLRLPFLPVRMVPIPSIPSIKGYNRFESIVGIASLGFMTFITHTTMKFTNTAIAQLQPTAGLHPETKKLELFASSEFIADCARSHCILSLYGPLHRL